RPLNANDFASGFDVANQRGVSAYVLSYIQYWDDALVDRFSVSELSWSALRQDLPADDAGGTGVKVLDTVQQALNAVPGTTEASIASGGRGFALNQAVVEAGQRL